MDSWGLGCLASAVLVRVSLARTAIFAIKVLLVISEHIHVVLVVVDLVSEELDKSSNRKFLVSSTVFLAVFQEPLTWEFVSYDFLELKVQVFVACTRFEECLVSSLYDCHRFLEVPEA